ncbi:autoinhibited Ca2+-ATPase 11 [Prunus dulcis]|uniref:Autoinhibited Ca2+-ATPase 11 n=1 Tax=Prunus dulcis TaxID=3755 RepID=A0A5H2XS70_PRUDU|nr:autoinhibited Ca2+-ATPase 11 [Prunus dulcis]
MLSTSQSHRCGAWTNSSGPPFQESAYCHSGKSAEPVCSWRILDDPNLAADIVLPENQVLALPLISAEVPKRSLEEYLMLFRHCTKRSAAQWQVVIRRTYPWFQAGFRLFEKEPEDEVARTDFRKKFLSITLPRDLPHGGGKPPNHHLGAEVYHPNFCARQLGCPQLIPLKSYRSCNRASSWRDADDLEVHKDARCAVNKINNSADAFYPSWEPNSCSSADFDTWWYARFQNLPASVTALKVLFDGWENWLVFADGDARAHMIQTIKDINAQIIEDPSLTKNVGGQSVQAGEVIVSSVIAAGDLELPSADEEDDVEAEETPAEAVPSGRRKRKGAGIPAGSPSPPPTKLKKLKKKGEVEYFAVEEAAAIPISPSGTDDELREAFEEVEQEKELQELEEVPQKKVAAVEEEDEIPAEVIVESIALAQKQQKGPSAELTSSELALFEDAEAEHSTAIPEAEEQAELTVVVPEAEVGTTAAAPVVVLQSFPVEVPKATGALAAVSSPPKPPIVAVSLYNSEMPIHSLPGSSATASLLTQNWKSLKLWTWMLNWTGWKKLSSPPSKAKSRAVQEAMERLKIWQSTELEFDEDKGVLDQLMKDLDLLHRQNMAPKPILEMGLSLARDVLNLHDRYEDLKPTFKTSEFCKATHEANLADFARQKAELDQMVAGYKEAKATADKLEKQIEELQKQLAECREVQNRLGTGLSSKTKATFLVQSMVAASRPALEIAEASIHQGVLLQKELSVKKANLQETLGKLGF